MLISSLLTRHRRRRVGTPARRAAAAALSSRLLTLLLPALPVAAGAQRGAQDREWLIVPERPGALLAPSVSEASLRRRFGSRVVQRARLGTEDGGTVPGTVLFPDDPDRRLELVWLDTVARRGPARLVLRGARSQWRLPGNVSLGTSLRELERVNGRPFVLTGFGWDYGGGVIDWRGGTLGRLLGGTVRLFLAPPPARRAAGAYATVLGDREYASSLPAMRQLAPAVWQIFIDAR